MKGLNWTAIAIGIAVSVAFWVAGVVLSMVMPMRDADSSMMAVMLVYRVLGFGGRLATGFAAGWFAGTRGALHGALAGLGAAIAGWLLSFGLMAVMNGPGGIGMGGLEYWALQLGWSLVGIGLAALAGHLATTSLFRKPV